MRRISRTISAGGYLLVLAVLVIDAGLVSASLRAIARTTAQVDHARQVIAALEFTLSSLKDAETGQRGYLLTEREGYLLPFRAAESELDKSLNSLRTLTADNRVQQARAEELTRFAAEKMAELRETITLRREQGLEPALKIVLTDRGKAAMDRTRQVVAEFRAEESRLLEERKELSRAAVRRTVITFGVTTGTALLLLAGVSILRRREAAAAAAIRKSEAWLSTTLTSIGDAVIATDERGRLRFLNPIAEALTGWPQADAVGKPMQEVFSIINEYTRKPAEDPVERVLREGIIVGLANHTVLVGRKGTETPIEDSAAPIKDDQGHVVGVVLVFRDVSERKRQEELEAEQKRLAEFGRDVGFALTESTSLREMLERSTELTVRHLDGAFARIWTLNEAGDELELQASSGLYTHIDGPHARVPVGKFKIGMIAQERKPHLTNSVLGDPRVPAQEWAAREGLVGFAGYPLIVEDRLVGVWALFSRQPLSKTTLRAMESVANGIALGIERKSAEEALRESEARKAAILETALDAIITIDHQGRTVEFNPAAEHIFGYARTDVIGREMCALIVPPAFREALRRGLAHFQATGEGPILGKRIEITAQRADGSEFPAELAVTHIPADGPPLFTAHVRDISERRRADQRMRFLAEAGVSLAGSLDYKETLKNIAHLAVNGFADFCFFDLAVEDGDRIERVAWAHADPRLQEMIDRIPEFVPPKQFTEHPVVRTITTGRTELIPFVDDEWLRRTSLDTARFEYLKDLGLASVLCVPVPASDGIIGALTFCLTNGSRPFDDADARLAEDLGRRAGVSLQNALLYREAEEANRSKSQFLAVLSHELRTPLNPILLAVTSMLEQPSPIEDLRPNLEMIRQYVNLQARLIDDLLDVMRIVRGKMPLHWEVADGHALIQRAIDVCRSEVLGKELRLQFELNAPHRHLNADPARLQQVFWNLIKNAVKFTPAQGTITIRTRNETDRDNRGVRLIIEVTDTGIGIEPEILPKVFDPFQQGESTITRKFGGLGLGLAICKGIVEGHGGLLAASSAGIGQGTTFTIELRALPDPRAAVLGQPSVTEPATNTPPLAARKILLVEDEQATLRLMVRLLRGLGHQVEAAGTIAEALEVERTSDFDLIISDIGLPDGSGLELMRRTVARRGPVSAIALTGYGMEEDIQRSREAGFTAHMTKPIDFTKLEAMIRKISM